jgi:multisubunit Na+/H+ antiporter MnhB subunit
MKAGGQAMVAAAARLYAPILVVVALSLLIRSEAGRGMAFLAGLLFAFAPLLHALCFGAMAARRAFPPLAARVLLAGGLLASMGSLTMDDALTRSLLGEAGAFTATAAASVLIMMVLMGRAPTLPDTDW